MLGWRPRQKSRNFCCLTYLVTGWSQSPAVWRRLIPVPFDYAKDLVEMNSLDQFNFVATHMAALTKNDELAPCAPGRSMS